MIEKLAIDYLTKRGYKIEINRENPPKSKGKVRFLEDATEKEIKEMENPKLSKFLKQFKIK